MHFGCTNMGANMHCFSATAISFWLFSNGTPRNVLYLEWRIYFCPRLYMKCPSIVCVRTESPFATSAQIQLLMCLHFSGLSFRRPSCGISLYDFTIRASLQLIFSCGICHSWTHFISAKVGPYLSKMYCTTKPHTTRKERRNSTDKSEYTSANLQLYETCPKRVLGICAQSVIFYYR